MNSTLLPSLAALAVLFVPEHRNHPKAGMESWVVHGHLHDEQGNEVGLSATFFTGRYLFLRGTAVLLGIMDVSNGRLYQGEEMMIPFFSKVQYGEERLDLVYGDSSLVSRDDGAVLLEMTAGDGEVRLDIRLPDQPTPYAGTGGTTWEGGWLRGYSYMGSQAEGEVRMGGRTVKVRGEVNLDHGWASELERNKDLVMIELDDGTRLNLSHRHGRDRPAEGSFLDIQDPSGAFNSTADYSIMPVRRWVGDKSRASYPVEWRLAAPSEDLDMVFVPAFDAQEIDVHGLVYFWAGVGKVSGRREGREVSGRYCAFLQGHE